MLTSRMVLATGSVQLFVQRCLLGLESAVPSSAIDIDLWHWMKNYRVWEANRKIFLYPENWIQPELRDDKTPLFKALEQGLLSDELNGATVEREYLRYLKSLDEIANLEIAGVYQDSPTATQKVLHVFGRSHNAPRNYHYRRWDGSSWTCWEPLDIGIEGDHLVPAVWNDRLFLLWPMLIDATVEVDIVLEDGSPGKTQMKYQLARLPWSEYRDGVWSPKSVSAAEVDRSADLLSSNPQVYDPAELAFWTKSLGPDALALTFHASCHFRRTGQSFSPGTWCCRSAAKAASATTFASAQRRSRLSGHGGGATTRCGARHDIGNSIRFQVWTRLDWVGNYVRDMTVLRIARRAVHGCLPSGRTPVFLSYAVLL